jgi:thiol-disulfide isomerase/thioredoxin
MSLTAISSGQSNLGDVPWVDATEDSDGGSIAVLSTLVDNHSSFSSSVSEAPILIEVYTATWCETCIPAEDALDSETSELDVEIIKFHRHLFEVEDPFGNNNTEGRWLSRYGPASAAAEQSSRTPPTIIVSGERMHIGSTPSPGMTLAEEYRESLNLVTSPPISENSSLEITWDGQILDWSWEWEEEKSRCRTACDSVTTDLTLLIRETSGDFPEGANGQGVYYNILRDAMPLDAAGSTNLELPSAWDGDDLELVFIVDWVEHPPKTSLFQELPFENPLSVIVIIFLGAIFAPLTRKFDAGFNNPR